ncbi:DUF547 domain-containing protein [Nostoc sp. UIC 10630]|uniref:DUF547 domain-containing protein n=1 Tax=Nostoc sp. LEGE 12447 TaxID=1828640 RepID=UPI001933B62A
MEKRAALSSCRLVFEGKNLAFKYNCNNFEQLAFWINLYNAFTISTILERYPIESIRPRILGISNWLAFL